MRQNYSKSNNKGIQPKMDSAVFNNIKKYIIEKKIINTHVFWLKIKLDRQYEFEQYILKNPKNKKQVEAFIRKQRKEI